MRQEPSFFDDYDPRLIYIAKKLKESLAVEILLSENEVDYGVETDNYRGGYVFQSERVGVFFYVRSRKGQTTEQFLIGGRAMVGVDWLDFYTRLFESNTRILVILLYNTNSCL